MYLLYNYFNNYCINVIDIDHINFSLNLILIHLQHLQPTIMVESSLILISFRPQVFQPTQDL